LNIGSKFSCFLTFVIILYGLNNGSCKIVNKTDTEYSISGEIRGADTGWVYILHRETGKIDSARIEHGFFKVVGKTGSPEFCNMGLGSMGNRAFSFGIFLEANRMKFIGNKDSLFDAAVLLIGSATQAEFKQFQESMKPIDSAEYQLLMATKNSDNPDSIGLKIKEVNKKRKERIWAYALKHPNSFISSFEAFSYCTEVEDLPGLDSLYHKMSPDLQNWYYSEKINQRLIKYGLGNKK